MRILFFMPSVGRTGSDVALYNLICHAAGKEFEMAVACRFGGELLEELPPGIHTFVQQKWGKTQRLYAGLRRHLLNEDDHFILSAHREFKPDLWYVNTVVQPEIVNLAKRINIPCVLHTHELEPMLARVSQTDAATMASYPRLIIACSQTAREVFSALGRSRDIEVCYETINPARIKVSQEPKEIRRRLGVSDATFVWASSGSFDSNKNQSRLLEIAAEMLRNNLDVHFMLLGSANSGYGLYCQEKARTLGIWNKVSFLGARTDDYYDYLNAADALVVTSSYESFSIVTAEAGYLGKPVAAFNCGGVSEIVLDKMGVVINSWNSSDLMQAMAALMNGQTPFDSERAKERVKEFYVEEQGALWEGFMRRYFDAASASEQQAAGKMKNAESGCRE